MRRIRIIHKVRTLLALLVFAGLLAAAGALWWANQTGLPDSWRGEIEKALAKQGLHADIAGLRYWPLQGVEADEVTIYGDATHQRVLARLREVMVDVDRTKLARGEVRVERLDLKGGSLSLPADPEDPQSKVLEVENASGRVLMPGGRRFEVINAKGEVKGIQLEFEALILGYRQRPPGTPFENEQARAYRRKQLTRVIDLLDPWQFDAAAPPVIRLRVEGDLDDPKTVRADVFVKSGALEHGGVSLKKFEAKGEMRGRLLVLESLHLEDEGGSLAGRMEYDMADRSGRFEANSNLELPVLLKEFDAPGWLDQVSFQARPQLSARGDFKWPENGKPSIHVTGHLMAEHLRFQGHSASRVETDVAWNGANVFLDNLVVTRPDGTLRGRLLAKPDMIRYDVSTDLRMGVWQGFFDKHPLGKVLADFKDRDDTKVDAHVTGRINRNDKHDWTAKGEVRATHMAYKGTPFREGSVKMNLNHDFLDFTEGEVEFDYANYAMRKEHGGPMTGRAKVERVRWDREPATITLDGIEGNFWPAPVLRCFLPKVADNLEEYRFHTTPKLSGGGVIGLFERGSGKTDFRVNGSTAGLVSYRFVGKDLLLSGLKTKVQVKPRMTEVRDLTFDLFDGPVRGKFDILPGEGRTRVKGELDWTRLSMPELSAACGFEKKAKGFVTGRIEFDHHGEAAAGLNGEGLIALEEGELFAVPIFGPLSPVLSAVLASRKAGFQEAKDAFCTFSVKEGVMRTDDFLTTTPSLVFTGDATADLNRLTLEMTIRMNARGLLGVITLPLKPFYGLFQFRGIGPLKEPKWDNVMFTSPPESEKERLLAPPRARDVRPVEAR
ncbi:hypothetical protein OKA05_19020 [Luteolibacter arcticus]|uniref:AsmA-like C-terminal domain-containing protein n=1 Tax=Luteolibacter arcticus TaxID=1581411 RepID=A0ABT3GMG9_9BACT|nr:AsmA-like C-terminal region-containing protein [Luteolibacter arcticus]MCW1924665.1 hypothetical protein [Luteolibacter arcticus]